MTEDEKKKAREETEARQDVFLVMALMCVVVVIVSGVMVC